MALITIELSTDDKLDLAILDAVNEAIDLSGEKIVIPVKPEIKIVPDPGEVFTEPAPTATTPAPAPAPAPAAPAAPAPAPALTSVELDCEGLPWDVRIHTVKKTKLISGQWKLKRGVPTDTVSIVTEELRSVMALSTGTTATAPAPAPVPEAVPEAGVRVDGIDNDNTPIDFPSFVMAISKRGITNDIIAPILATRNIAGLNLLASRPDLIPELWAELKASPWFNKQ
jgi:hypothetical protein